MARKRPPPLLESDLPESARNLVRLIGWAKAQALIEARPGVPFPMPLRRDANSAGAARYEHLVELVGARSAEILHREYAGSDMPVPACKKAIAAAAHRAMRARYDQGATLEDIALEFGCTPRWVSVVLKRSDEAFGQVLERSGQMGLF